MKNIVKTVIWISIMYLLESVFVNIIDIRGATPLLLTAFAAAYASRERRFSSAVYMMLICGVLEGSLVGKDLPISILAVMAAGLSMYSFRLRLRFVPMWIKNVLCMAAVSFLAGAAEFYAASGFSEPMSMFPEVIPVVIYTAAAALIVYPAVKRTLFFGDEAPKRFAI